MFRLDRQNIKTGTNRIEIQPPPIDPGKIFKGKGKKV